MHVPLHSPFKASLLAAFVTTTLLAPAIGFAQSSQAAYVQGVQMPAWVERGGVKQPLAAGVALMPGDKVSTGKDSRLLLKMSEGSEIKLGENAQFNINSLSTRQENRQTFVSAALEVAKGAFRFTTDARLKLSSKRDVSVKFATVTAGIRGTDLWGKSAPDRDIVCLIEGDIGVQRDGDSEFRMNQALQFYITPKTTDNKVDRSKPAPAVVPVPPEKLAEWAVETEISKGKGALVKGGKWKVVLVSSDNQADALTQYDSLRTLGYPAEIHPRLASGKRVYDVRVAGLPSKEEAQALGTALESQVNGANVRVTL